MSANNEETRATELVIIRRGGHGEEGGHHGGVWKIAYADFMTAMMAFFLVMWLINSTDQKTLTQVATYFNPLRLTDKVAVSRGVQQESGAQSKQSPDKDNGAKEDATKPHQSKTTPAKAGKQRDHGAKGETKTDTGNAKYTDEALFQDPYAVLAKLAAEAAAEQSRAVPRPPAGEAFRDPFDPDFRRAVRTKEPQPKAGVPLLTVPPPAKAEPADKAADAKPGQAKPSEAKPSEAGAAAARTSAVQPADPKPADPKPGEAKAAPAAAAQATQATAQVEAERGAERLDAEIRRALGQSMPGALPQIQVSATSEGILVSLTDDYEFGMFAIASAEPRPAMVVVMEKLAKVLAGRPEMLVVRGHTDGRPYKGGGYDNWRLSTARAHMAYYMLVRGGIGEQRFARVEGHADRALKLPADPEAAQNRRIEILLSKAKP